MDHGCPRHGVVLFIYVLAINLTISLLLVTHSDGRYLRPSDHGLSYQDPEHPTKATVPEMISFFNGGKAVSFPEAKNLTGSGGSSSRSDPAATWWNNRERRRSRDAHKDHVREILLVTSLVCGLSGVVLLVVSASLCLLRYRKRRLQLEEQSSKERSLSTSASTPSALPVALGNK